MSMFNPARPSQHISQHQFSSIQAPKLERSSIDMSYGHKTTISADYIYPFANIEILPGDTMTLKPTFFSRFTALQVPYIDNLYFDYFVLYTPYRIVWDSAEGSWKRFMGEQRDPGDSTDFLVPQIAAPAGGFGVLSVYDYMGGIPIARVDSVTGFVVNLTGFSIDALDFRAWNMCINEWFRDENLVDSVPSNFDNGPDAATDYTLFKRRKKKDYFTGCLPWPQKGPSVTIPLSGNAPVVGDGGNINIWNGTTRYGLGELSDAVHARTSMVDLAAGAAYNNTGGGFGDVVWALHPTANSGMEADLSAVFAATINQLRDAIQIQRLYERDARGGTRWTEILQSHFSVIAPDATLQRPEYLGGGTSRITITPVAQTAQSDTTPLANLAAIGVLDHHGSMISKSFIEHGTVQIIGCIRADLSYQNGLARKYSRRTRFDFYWPVLAHLGEQAVLNKELFLQGSAAINPVTSEPYDEEVFGYQERWAEYKYNPNLITGALRSTYGTAGAPPTSLDVWHLAQNFTTLPELGETFVNYDTPIDRVVTVTDEPPFVVDCWFQLRMARVMPLYSTPGYMDHF